MTQELLDLRNSILEGRYADALAIIDELEGISRQAILRNVELFLVRLLIHLIKNQVEQRSTNSWAASITDSVRQIQKLNLKDNRCLTMLCRTSGRICWRRRSRQQLMGQV